MKSACALTVALVALMALGLPAQAAPVDSGAMLSATDLATSTAVHYLDLSDELGVVDPQFSWDPIPRASRYEVEVNSSSDWAVGSRVCCNERAIGTSLSPLKLLPNNTYYWRMRGFDAAGNAGPWKHWCGEGVASCPDNPRGFEKTFDAVIPSIPNLRVRDSAGDRTPRSERLDCRPPARPSSHGIPFPGRRATSSSSLRGIPSGSATGPPPHNSDRPTRRPARRGPRSRKEAPAPSGTPIRA